MKFHNFSAVSRIVVVRRWLTFYCSISFAQNLKLNKAFEKTKLFIRNHNCMKKGTKIESLMLSSADI